ncbi:hypothetical protein O181_025001 [Austropuccinia psidii MF-1]|uniref:Uncharacterized protein n=1 Tax=Austropuccinia psidii MF-1 TaxID=1389203 RepID=A0A9Q3CMJ5_9BASI|nr:hypothetical protein [Austropuccinia psidii MF-1]
MLSHLGVTSTVMHCGYKCPNMLSKLEASHERMITVKASMDKIARLSLTVSLLSLSGIHPNNGYTQEGLPSAQFQSLLALPPHPTGPPGSHEKIKEKGPYPLERDEVNI